VTGDVQRLEKISKYHKPTVVFMGKSKSSPDLLGANGLGRYLKLAYSFRVTRTLAEKSDAKGKGAGSPFSHSYNKAFGQRKKQCFSR